MRQQFTLLFVVAFALSACSGRIIPAPSGSAPPPSKTASPPQSVDRPVATQPVAPAPAAATSGANALSAGVMRAPAEISSLFDDAGATRALKAFRASCSGLIRRKDLSGLTTGDDWKPACTAAAGWSDRDAAVFFGNQFDAVQVGDGKSFATGYYEPEIPGSRTRQPGYDVPVYKRPPDLVEIDLGDFSSRFEGKSIRGKIEGNAFVPYADRGGIEAGALEGRGLEIAWVKDPIDFFFLQVQGSGRLRLPDGGMMRIGYNSQNGHDYTGIGKLMRDRGLVGPGQANIQGLTAWLREHPDEGRAIMRENKSWVFFREIVGPGPLGAMGIAITDRGSIAADPAFIPLGAPVILSMDRPEPNGIWIAQDTGGAIKGANRVDTYWGGGAEAYRIAGGMSARGTAILLLPKGVIDRLIADPRNGKKLP